MLDNERAKQRWVLQNDINDSITLIFKYHFPLQVTNAILLVRFNEKKFGFACLMRE